MYDDSRSPRRRAEARPRSMLRTAASGSPTAASHGPLPDVRERLGPLGLGAAAGGEVQGRGEVTRARSRSPVASAARPIPATALAPMTGVVARVLRPRRSTSPGPARRRPWRRSWSRRRARRGPGRRAGRSWRSTLSARRRPCAWWPRSHQYIHSAQASRAGATGSPAASRRSAAAVRLGCSRSTRASAATWPPSR